MESYQNLSNDVATFISQNKPKIIQREAVVEHRIDHVLKLVTHQTNKSKEKDKAIDWLNVMEFG